MKKDYLVILKACLVSLLIMGIILPQLAGASEGSFWSWLKIFGSRSQLNQPQIIEAPETSNYQLATLGNVAFLQSSMPIALRHPQYAPYCVYKAGVSYCLTTVTAYSSTPEQTDSSPFITANGQTVKDGIVACNFLPFGTKVRFPELYGNKIFSVEDRMAAKNSHKVDIWFPSTWQAQSFGIQSAKVEILN